jgi:hypothetical protein
MGGIRLTRASVPSEEATREWAMSCLGYDLSAAKAMVVGIEAADSPDRVAVEPKPGGHRPGGG